MGGQNERMQKRKSTEKPSKHQLFFEWVRGIKNQDIFTPGCEAFINLQNNIQASGL
jgi:hypothetical protein